jgi:hypothetical protein
MSNNLNLSQIAGTQLNKHVTANDQAGQLALGNGALLAQVVLTRGVSFADDFAGAWAYAGVSATTATVLDVHRNGAPIGTITFGTGASAGHLCHGGRRCREPSRRGIASRSSTRTRRMPRSPISRSPFWARGPDHGLGFRYRGHPADRHHDGAVLRPGPDAQPAGDGALPGVGRLPGFPEPRRTCVTRPVVAAGSRSRRPSRS